MSGKFTGQHMTAILIGGFGIVIAVNLLMATLAIRGFGGVVVKNSYVASQNFNTLLARSKAQDALGWNAHVGRAGDGRLVVTTSAPAGSRVRADLRRPVGNPALTTWHLVSAGDGRFASTDRLPEGRWLVRITIDHGADHMQIEKPVG